MPKVILMFFSYIFCSEIDLLQTIVPSTNQLIDLSLEPQDNVNFNNNNSLITTNTTLVTADSHENKGKYCEMKCKVMSYTRKYFLITFHYFKISNMI